MEIICYALPLITAIFLLLFFRKECVWWEYIILIVPSLLLFLLSRTIMVSANQADIEYLGSYVTKIRHYDEWDEWVERTCSREVPSGTDSEGNTIYTTEYYDCSYRDYHPEKWTYFDANGHEGTIFYKEDFNKFKKQLGNPPMKFVDMKRDYYRIDGDAQDYYWDGREKTICTLTSSHRYKNKIQNSRSIFNFTEIDEKDVDSLGLYRYPELDWYDQTPVVSEVAIPKDGIDAIKYINGYYGQKYQFRNYILVYQNKDLEISELQRSYWKGGNKNELVVCIGVDDSLKVKWCNAFSWCDAPVLDVKTESYFMETDSLDLVDYSKMLRSCLENGDWVRKEFIDFDYIKSEVSTTQEIILLILVTLYNIGMSIFIVVNKIKN